MAGLAQATFSSSLAGQRLTTRTQHVRAAAARAPLTVQARTIEAGEPCSLCVRPVARPAPNCCGSRGWGGGWAPGGGRLVASPPPPTPPPALLLVARCGRAGQPLTVPFSLLLPPQAWASMAPRPA